MNVLTVKIPRDLRREIDQAARRERISRSELARRAMAAYVARRGRQAGTPSAADFAGVLIGSVRGTPPDLASNPDYLDDLGR